jgi:long-chain-acyl-CoA dehydrogenase
MWAYTDRAMMLYKDQKLTADEAAKVKFWTTDREAELLDVGVQLHGGYGYITEYKVERDLRDAKLTEIGEGTSEIQRMVIARNLLGVRAM